MNNDNAKDRYGSSHFATQKEIKAAIKKKVLSEKMGLYIATHPYTGKRLFLTKDQHIYFTGGAGSGKTTGLILPIMLGLGGEQSIVCNDPKGEICCLASPLAYKRGIQVFCFNCYGLHGEPPWNIPQHRYMIISCLDPESVYFVADVSMLAQAAIIAPPNSKDAHFTDKARMWFSAFLIFLKTTLPDASLVDLRDLLNMVMADFETFTRLVESGFASNRFDLVGTTGKEIVEMQRHSPREYSGILSTLSRCLDWLNDPAIRESVKTNDFDPSVLANGRTHVYYIMPVEYMQKNAPLTRLFFASFMIYQQRHRVSAKVLYVMDEAGQMGKFEELERGFSFGRGFGNQILAAFQNNFQAEGYTGGAMGLMASAGARIFTGIRDLETARTVSAMLGMTTYEFDNAKDQEYAAVKAHENRMKILNGQYDILTDGVKMKLELRNAQRKERIQRPLMTPDEVMALPDDRMIVFTAETGCPPILAKKVPYFLMPELAGRYFPNPYRPPFDRVEVKGKFFKRNLKIVTEPVPEQFAHFPQFKGGYYARFKMI